MSDGSDVRKHPALQRLGGVFSGPPMMGMPMGGAMGPRPIDTMNVKQVKRKKKTVRDFVPSSWTEYYDKRDEVHIQGTGNTFTVYQRGEIKEGEGPVLFMLHGGGHSSLSWAVFASEITLRVKCAVVAMDFRGHGSTVTTDDEDLSLETMCGDIGAVIKALFPPTGYVPPIVLIGHSMGGALAVHTVARKVAPIAGMVVIDVVEGSAMESLSGMVSFLRSRPQVFDTEQAAVEWAIKSGQLRSVESAKISMPAQLKRLEGDNIVLPQRSSRDISAPLMEEDEEEEEEEGEKGAHAAQPKAKEERIEEEPEEEEGHEGPGTHKQQEQPQEQGHSADSDGFVRPKPFRPMMMMPTGGAAADAAVSGAQLAGKYTWRIDLEKTEKFWPEWFQGLSKMFLSAPTYKLLLLAGVDRLDTDLTIGQMQGKFQLAVLSDTGHCVQEDAADKAADAVATFLLRQRLAKAM